MPETVRLVVKNTDLTIFRFSSNVIGRKFKLFTRTSPYWHGTSVCLQQLDVEVLVESSLHGCTSDVASVTKRMKVTFFLQ